MKIIAPVPALCSSRSPNAITWIISIFIIGSLKRHSGGLWSHVCKKLRETISPLIAHSNATITIVLIVGNFWIFTTLLGMQPSAVFCCSIGMPVDGELPAQQFFKQTATAFCFSSSERMLSYDQQRTTITLNMPSSIPIHSRSFGQDDESFKALAGQVETNWHDTILAGVSA